MMPDRHFRRGKEIDVVLIQYPVDGADRERLIDLGQKAVTARNANELKRKACATVGDAPYEEPEECREFTKFEADLRERVGVHIRRPEFLVSQGIIRT